MPRNLLVVDDSATIRDAVRYALTGEDWVVLTAADTAEALDTVRDSAIDAVLCDASLAPDDGYEACRALRSAMGDEPVPIVVMGGKVSENLAASAGATAVLPKPFETEELLEVLRTGLEQGSFDLAAEDFAPLDGEDEEEIMADLAPAATEAGSSVEEEVEVIDLSGDDEAEDLEFLQDLQPLTPAPAGAAEDSAVTAGDWELDGMIEPLDLDEPSHDEEPEEVLSHTGPVEFDLADLGGDEEVETSPVGEAALAKPAADVEVSTEGFDSDDASDFDLQDLDLDLGLEPEPVGPPSVNEVPVEPTAELADLQVPSRIEVAADDDLLGDIDLEGWAEESVTTAEATIPTLETSSDLSWNEPASFESEADREASEPAETVVPEPPPEMEAEGEEILEEEVIATPPLFGEGDFPEAALLASEALGTMETGEASAEPMRDAYGATEEPEPELPPAEPETDATWAEPPPAPAASVPWDQDLPREDALTEPVARAAEQAVREALTRSLSPQALTPVVEAVVERVVWEVVPQLAERLIREAIERLQQEPTGD